MYLGSDRTDASRTLFVSWMSYHGRSDGLCRALPARCAFVGVGRVTDRRTAVLRHLVQLVRTVWLLLRERPRVLWVMAPPSDLVALALLWRGLTGCRVVVDAHSKAVLDPATGTPRNPRLLRRADLTVVTTGRLAGVLAERGVRALPLHDAPLDRRAATAPARRRVVLPASWYADEPWPDVLAAAELLPDVDFVLTGRAPDAVRSGPLPPNVTLTGFLAQAHYDELLASAAVVLALTTREDTMQRAAYEAVAAGRPVVASGTEALRSYLTAGAVFTSGGGPDLARAVVVALDNADRLAVEARALAEQHAATFRRDLAAVTSLVAAA